MAYDMKGILSYDLHGVFPHDSQFIRLYALKNKHAQNHKLKEKPTLCVLHEHFAHTYTPNNYHDLHMFQLLSTCMFPRIQLHASARLYLAKCDNRRKGENGGGIQSELSQSKRKRQNVIIKQLT